MLMPGKGITNGKVFSERALKRIHEYMLADGLASVFVEHISPYTREVSFSKANDKRVLGSMNDLIYQAKCYMFDMGLDLTFVNQRLNKSPMTMLNHKNPRMALLELGQR